MENKNFQNIILVEIFIFILICFWFVYEYSKNINPQRTFSVTGEGKEIVIPNIAEVRIGLITEGNDLIKIQEESSKKFNKVIEFLKSKGIDNKDIKTEDYSITPKYKYDKVTTIIGYTISQNLSVKIRDLKKINEILAGVVKNGANNIYGPNFTIDEEKIYLEKAREKAIIEAKEKALKISKLAGFRLGKILTITENIYQPYPVYSFDIGQTIGGAGGERKEIVPQIEPGSKEIKLYVTITYEIK